MWSQPPRYPKETAFISYESALKLTLTVEASEHDSKKLVLDKIPGSLGS